MCVTEICEYYPFVKAKQKLLDLPSAGKKTANITANSSINYNKKQNTHLIGYLMGLLNNDYSYLGSICFHMNSTKIKAESDM